MSSYLDFLHQLGNHRRSKEERLRSLLSYFENETGKGEACRQIALGKVGAVFTFVTTSKRFHDGQDRAERQRQETYGLSNRVLSIVKWMPTTKKALWVVTVADKDVKQRLEDLTRDTGRREDREFQDPGQYFQSRLAVHLLLCHWACENWRAYLHWLDDNIEEEVR